jgi:hypothetical protein
MFVILPDVHKQLRARYTGFASAGKPQCRTAASWGRQCKLIWPELRQHGADFEPNPFSFTQR